MTKQEHPDVAALRTAFTKAFLTEISFNTLGACCDIEQALLKKYMNGSDTDTAYEIAKYWLAHTAQVWPTHGIMGRNADDLESFVCFVNRNSLAEKLIRDSDDANTLASVCMVHALVAGTGGFKIDPINIKTLMTTWLGYDVDCVDVQKVEPMVGLLYGKAAWSLYLPDVDHLTFLPVHLWSLRLPLPSYPQSAGATVAMGSSTLPFDVA